MRHASWIAAILLALPLELTPAAMGQTIKLPTEVRGAAGAFIVVKADSDGAVRWYTPDVGLSLFPPELLKDSKTAVVTGATGRYRLIGWTAKGDVPSGPAECIVVIGDVPPGPVPPGPTPPVPPVPPGPVDPLTKALQAAYDKDPDPAKAELKSKISDLYRLSAKTAQNPALVTWGALYKVMAEAFDLLDIKLVAMRQILNAELSTSLPYTTATPLDAKTRELAAATFTRIADCLDRVK